MTSNFINEFREKFGSTRNDHADGIRLGGTGIGKAHLFQRDNARLFCHFRDFPHPEAETGVNDYGNEGCLNKDKQHPYDKMASLKFVDIDAYLAQRKWKTGEGRSQKMAAIAWLKQFVALAGGKLSPLEAIEVLRKVDGVDQRNISFAHKVLYETVDWKRTAAISLKDVNDYGAALLRGDKIWGNEQPRVEIDSVWTLGAKFFLHKIGQELNCDLNETICIMGARDIDEISVTKRTSAVHLFHTLSLETRMSYVDAAEQLIRRTKIYLDLKAANLV